MRPFILPRYILREHLGPFCFSFAMMTLLFLLDLVFRHLSRILSKGLPPAVVMEFFGLNLAWIVATVAPMAVLTATLMAFGRLAADNEITAMQAGGVSLLRQAMPVFIAAAALTAGLIWFNNNVLPDFNYRARVLAMDIARKKPGVKIEPGVWCHEIPHYGLLAQALEDSAEVTKASALLINDNNQPELRRTISARTGLIQANPSEGGLSFTLFNGEIQEINLNKLEEFRRLTFTKHSLSMPVDETMFFYRSESDLRTDREKSVTAMWQEVEESRAATARLAQKINSLVGADLEKHFGQSFGLGFDSLALAPAKSKAGLLLEQKSSLRQISDLLANLQHLQRNAQKLLVEIHKKYAIAVACLVFVLIGAPLGVLARRGSLATGTALSLGFFLLYWACLIGGEDLADREIVSPFMAMWSANFLTGGFGFSVFRRIATGKFAPRSLRVESWFSRFSFRNLFGIFRRRRRTRDESLYRLNRYEPVEMETRRLVWGSEGEDNNNDVAVLPTMWPNENQPAAHEGMSTSAPTVSSSPLAFTPVAEILNQFTNRIRANLVLLADRNGKPLAYDNMSHVKLPPSTDLEMIAKLAAGQIAATREIARTVEDDGRIDSILQEGTNWNSFIYPIDEDYILIAIVEKSVVIGLVRLQANEVVPSLRKVLEMI
ncbi:LptF/LptG family permease [candidate division KSB1 bacterium]|nr:LptF/LptG family permease [candidate division KSB1 bacterium]